MMKVAVPRLYLGTMTFAWSQTSSVVDESVGLEMVKRFVRTNEALGVDTHHIDTARIYAGGKTEPMVGQVLKELGSPTSGTVIIGTKAHPSVPKGLSQAGIQDQLKTSTDEMQVSSVGEYYLHQPDTEHSLLESLKCTHDLVTQGKISAVGMSNYNAKEMTRAFQLCKEHGLTAPTVYQGLYNPLNRLVEDELLGVLHENGCSFVAFNPLAAGLLTGKHLRPDEVVKGRFKDNPNYLPRFYTPANFEALNIIRAACEKEGISMVEATYRWLIRHSSLTATDGILLGASSLEQLDENLEACLAGGSKDGLSDEIIQAFDKAWKLTREGAFPYWRSYSSDMPNRDALDQGASYQAAKTTK